MSAEDIEYMGDYKEFPTKESALDWLDTYLSLDERNNLIRVLQQEPALDKIRAEIEQKIEQERFTRSVFRGEEKDAVKAEQCTGSIFAYNNVIRLIDKYRAEEVQTVELQESEDRDGLDI